MMEPETVIVSIEVPRAEAELMQSHADETNSPVAVWWRSACAIAGFYAPLATHPADLPHPRDFDDERDDA